MTVTSTQEFPYMARHCTSLYNCDSLIILQSAASGGMMARY